MDIASVISILLFILPGILAEKISHKMDFPTGKKRNDFMETINGIAFSFPILIIVVLYTRHKYGLNTITQYVDKINNLDFLFEFCLCALIVSVLAGIMFLPVKSLMRWAVNQFRVKILKKMKTDDKSCWRRFLIDDNAYKYLEVIKDGKSYKGFMGPFSLPDESREIILYTPDGLLYDKKYDADKIFKVVKSTYIDLEKNIVVHDYDIKDYVKWCDEQENKACENK